MAVKKRKKKVSPVWSKLDNTAILFPVIASEHMSNVYRLSVTLKEEVNPELLKKARDTVLEQFTVFRLRLKMGFFWYYFEENNAPYPDVLEESDYPGAYINKSRNKQYKYGFGKDDPATGH